MNKALLIDTTLRDGAQAPDIVLSQDQRVRIARLLVDLGITEIEAGVAAMGKCEQAAIQAVIEAVGPACRVSVWCRALRADLIEARACGGDTVHIAFPLSDAHLAAVGMNERKLFESLEHLVEAGRTDFSRVTVGCQDASRAPIDRVIAFAGMAMDAGASRVRIADTVGILTPLAVQELLTSIQQSIKNAVLDFHGHNDLGMATANAVTALAVGSAVSVTLGGIGERAGNAALEEVVMGASQGVSGLKLGVKQKLLVSACKELSAMLHRRIPSQKPIIGPSIFTHESGVHCHGLRKNSSSFEPFAAEKIGHAPSIVVGGTHSGSAGIQWVLQQQGINISRENARELCEHVRKVALQKKRSLFPHEIKRLYLIQSRVQSASPVSF
jgi:homocitrate synthase NifV